MFKKSDNGKRSRHGVNKETTKEHVNDPDNNLEPDLMTFGKPKHVENYKRDELNQYYTHSSRKKCHQYYL